MPDYGHDLMFGAMLEPERAVDAVALAVLAEHAGLDAVSLADHPYWPERLDTFALLAFIAARTDRVRVFPNLANLPLRPPADGAIHEEAEAHSCHPERSRGTFSCGARKRRSLDFASLRSG